MFRKIKDYLVRKLQGAFEWLKPKASTAITLVNVIKTAVENPLASWAVTLTKTQLDDQALAQAKIILCKASEEMLLAEKLIQEGTTTENVINTIIEYLKSKSKEARAKWYTELQGRLTVYLADGKIDLQEGIALGQMVYKEIHG